MVINAQEFQEAIEAIELSKGISRETILLALEEAMKKGYKKELGGFDDAVIEVNIEPEKGIIEMFQVKDIVEEVEDDFLQVSPEDANELEKNKEGEIRGDKFYIPASIETLKKATANSIKSILKQKFAEAEKTILYEAFKDKINTMITGKVEKVDERGCSVNIGRTSVFLSRKQMIGDERFNAGDDIRLFVEGVDSSAKGGARINVSRASEGFLKSLFFEEIREIYDGTIVIKSVAREAGERSKVAVFTNDPNVDPAGACIGQNGTRIQKIVAQLGNGQAKEKIDIIAYSENPGLYVMEALKPAKVVGVICDEENKSAVVIVKDDSLSLAIGRRGVNARLAVRLTGYNIDIKTESEAIEENLQYQSLEELQAIEMEALNQKIQQLQNEKVASHAGEVLPGLPEGYVAPQARVYEEETNDFDAALAQKVEEEEIAPAPAEEEEKVEETPVVEEVKVEEKKEEPAVEKVKEVKTTTTLSDLEKTLENESNKSKKSTGKKFSRKKKEEEEEEEVKPTASTDPSQYMSIYTEEELREMEEEEEEYDDVDEEEVDYDEYDEYYDDDDK